MIEESRAIRVVVIVEREDGRRHTATFVEGPRHPLDFSYGWDREVVIDEARTAATGWVHRVAGAGAQLNLTVSGLLDVSVERSGEVVAGSS